MSFIASKKAGYVLRMMSLGAFSFMMIFAAIMVLQNDELTKIIPDTPARSMAIFFGYIVAIFGFNYASAIKGRNFMGWKVESLTMAGLFFLFAGIFFSQAFPTSEIIKSNSWIPFLGSEEIKKPNYWYTLLSVLALPLFFAAASLVRKKRAWIEGNLL